MTNTVRSSTTPLSSLTAAEIDEWVELAARSLEPNPYFEPAFLTAAHRHLRTDVDPSVVQVRADGRLVGILPVVPVARWKGTPLRAVTTGPPVGATVADLHTPLLDPDGAGPAFEALIREALGHADLLVFETTRLEGATYDVLRRVAREKGWRVEVWRCGERGAVRPPSDVTQALEARPVVLEEIHEVGNQLVRRLDRGRRRGLVRSINRMESSLGQLTWTVREPVDDVLDEFVRLESSTWKSDAQRGGQGVVAVQGGEVWLRSVMRSLRKDGRGLVGELRAGDTLLFSSLAAVAGTTCFCLRDAYDFDQRATSPGVVGRLAEAAWAAAVPGLSLDSCINPFVYETASAIYPDRFKVGTLALARGPVAGLALGAVAALHRRRQSSSG